MDPLRELLSEEIERCAEQNTILQMRSAYLAKLSKIIEATPDQERQSLVEEYERQFDSWLELKDQTPSPHILYQLSNPLISEVLLLIVRRPHLSTREIACELNWDFEEVEDIAIGALAEGGIIEPSYLNPDGSPQRIDGARNHWQLTELMTETFPNLVGCLI